MAGGVYICNTGRPLLLDHVCDFVRHQGNIRGACLGAKINMQAISESPRAGAINHSPRAGVSMYTHQTQRNVHSCFQLGENVGRQWLTASAANKFCNLGCKYSACRRRCC